MRDEIEISGRYERLIFLTLASAFGVVLLRTAWLCDDAAISFRTVVHFVHGHGLTWNVSERVQTFTHPLWLLLVSLAYALTGELFYTTLFLCMVLTLVALGIVFFRLAVTALAGCVALAILLCSKAFIEYGTSGLEVALSYALVSLFVALACRPGEQGFRRLTATFSVAALAVVNRMDLGLLLLPAVLALGLRRHDIGSVVRAAAIGGLPLLGWLAFAIVYYGFPFPNSAYAKLSSGVSSTDLAVQGLYYFRNSLRVDPITLTGIAAGLVLAFARRSRLDVALALGVVLYLLYTIRIGGDFMSGRFFAAPLLVSAILIARLKLRNPWLAGAAAAAALALCLVSPAPIVTSGPDVFDQSIDDAGIADERGYYYRATGLLSRKAPPLFEPRLKMPNMKTPRRREVRIAHAVGIFALAAGPNVHFVDLLGLTDPLVARLPQGYGRAWRVGHYQRKLPVGYIESLESGENRIANENVAELYDKIRVVTRGKLWSKKRWKAIWFLNSGRYRALIQGYADLGDEDVITQKSIVYVPRKNR